MSTESILRTSRIEEAATAIDPVFLSTPLVCASAGNFGQGIAHAARSRGIGATVFAAPNANPLKVEAMRALGAEASEERLMQLMALGRAPAAWR